jgi:hypothetical protein
LDVLPSRSALAFGGLVVVSCGSRTVPAGGADGGPDADDPGATCPACDGPDLDGDGVPGAPCREDCDDGDPTIAPGLADPQGDGRDSNCDGADGVDRDGDGHLSLESGGDDCDDRRAFVRPGAPDGVGWVIEAFPAGIRTQLALDGWGRPVVAWVGRDSDAECEDEEWVMMDGYSTVEVSRWARGQWTTERVVRACTNGAIGLGVAADGTTWVAFAAGSISSSVLSVASDKSRRWTIEDLGPGYDDVALLIDRCQPTVAYTATWRNGMDGSSGRVARFASQWRHESFVEGHRATLLDIALAADGRIGASYVVDPGDEDPPPALHNDVGGAVRESGRWDSYILDNQGRYPLSDTAVCFGASGELIAAYGDRYGLWVLTVPFWEG